MGHATDPFPDGVSSGIDFDDATVTDGGPFPDEFSTDEPADDPDPFVTIDTESGTEDVSADEATGLIGGSVSADDILGEQEVDATATSAEEFAEQGGGAITDDAAARTVERSVTRNVTNVTETVLPEGIIPTIRAAALWVVAGFAGILGLRALLSGIGEGLSS